MICVQKVGRGNKFRTTPRLVDTAILTDDYWKAIQLIGGARFTFSLPYPANHEHPLPLVERIVNHPIMS
jgi:hypothetical protein